jgi:hypothetical protein
MVWLQQSTYYTVELWMSANSSTNSILPEDYFIKGIDTIYVDGEICGDAGGQKYEHRLQLFDVNGTLQETIMSKSYTNSVDVTFSIADVNDGTRPQITSSLNDGEYYMDYMIYITESGGSIGPPYGGFPE